MMRRWWTLCTSVFLGSTWILGCSWLAADEPPAATPPAASPDSEGLVRLAKDFDLWMDSKRKLLIAGGEICLREGQLEMFACPKGTKEHESIVAVNAPAKFLHAGLLAIGLKPGKPVQYDPTYVPASGPMVDVEVEWQDKEGQTHRVRAQEMVKNIKTGKAMEHEWVFAGSGFWKDPMNNEEYYLAEAGELICVSNFPTAMLDLTVKSSQDNAELMFVAFPERIPPRGTKVKLILKAKEDRKQPTTAKAPDPIK